MNEHVFKCPNCNREFRILSEFASEVIQCPHCNQKLRISPDYFNPQLDLTVETPKTNSDEELNQVASPHSDLVLKKEPKSDKDRSSTKGRVTQPSSESRWSHQTIERAELDRSKPKSSSEKSFEFADLQERASIRIAPQLPPQFVVAPSEEPDLDSDRAVESLSDNQVNLAPVNPSEQTAKEADSRAAAVVTGSSPESGNEPELESGPESTTEPDITHLLPPQFSVFDPSRFHQHRSSSPNQVLLPTADGGVQMVSQRLVTMEYKGEKYILVAMTPEEKRRRQLIANIVSVAVAIGAITGTLWILLK